MFERYLQARTAIGRLIPDLAGLYLFGSAAAQQLRADSDIDFAFLSRRPVPRQTVLELMGELAALFHRDVDLVDLSAAPTVLQARVLEEGVLIDSLDPQAVGLFEVEVMREYADLKMRRRPIERDIVERGRVYAR